MSVAYNTSGLEGIQSMIAETKIFDGDVKGVYADTAKKVYGNSEPKGISAYAYGSPGRGELVGGDADADVFIVSQERDDTVTIFEGLFKKTMSAFPYAKIDLPDWGSLKEIEIYLDKSLVEGNQVLETRFLIGDARLHEELEKIKAYYNSPERAAKNIIFNRFYYRQYFRQRSRNGVPNVKYCHGGSRELLLISWHRELIEMLEGTERTTETPRIVYSLRRLNEKGNISDTEYTETIEAINYLTVLRRDILSINKKTPEKGLTFLDTQTGRQLEEMGHPPFETTNEFFDLSRKRVAHIVDFVYNDTIYQIGRFKGKKWENSFRLAQTSLPERERLEMATDEPLVIMANLWEANEMKQKEAFNAIAQRVKNTTDWAIIGSVVCSPLCDPSLLEFFGTGKAKERGYGYLLRVIARNPNTPRSTLENISNDASLDSRYTEVAAAAMKGGNRMANDQV